MMMKQAKKCNAIIGKLQLLQHTTFHGHKIIHDKFKAKIDDMPIGRKFLFQMWLTFVRQKRVICSVDYIEAFPQHRERIMLWEDCLDENGAATIDSDKLYEYIKKRVKQKLIAKQLAEAEWKKMMRF